ncbi:LutC/YkgG family protein [Brevibacillus sp. H7]|uniref:LutC/YkgG family protein n=1 Tax=Brevibacillus sp. H7 TaxID=3349138 RepID=UPI0038197B31
MRSALQQEDFLNQIASKLGRPRRFGIKPPAWEQKPYERLHQGLDQEELIQQFIASLKELRTEVDRVPADMFPDVFGSMLHQFQVKSAVYWDDPRLFDLHVPKLLTEQQVEHRAWQVAGDEADLRSFAARADIGITFADAGLSETGTVVLFNGGGRGRLVSLLPPVYVVILQESSILPRLTEGAAYVQQRMKEKEDVPACINFITGPSRTGDIEMDLAFGVHGPGKVHVILLKTANGAENPPSPQLG